MELVLATLSLVVIAVVYIRYRYNKSLCEPQESIDDVVFLTKDKKMREIKFSYMYQHDDTGRILNKKFDIHEIELELIGECFIERYTLIARRQYTGLKDKNGVEIYEGDVVYLSGKGLTEIEFPFIELYQAYYENDIGTIKGNIYENPELLKDIK